MDLCGLALLFEDVDHFYCDLLVLQVLVVGPFEVAGTAAAAVFAPWPVVGLKVSCVQSDAISIAPPSVASIIKCRKA